MSAQIKPDATTMAGSPLAAVLAARAAQQQRNPPPAPAAQVTAIRTQPQHQTVDLVAAAAPGRDITAPPLLASSPASPSPAADWFSRLSSAATRHRNTMIEMAYYGRLLRESDAWQEVGFRDESHCRSHLGFSEVRWNEYITLGERLRHLTLDEMCELTQAAARLLTRVHPRIWDEYSWIEEATHLPVRDFQLLIESRNSQVAATAMSEPKSSFAVQVPISQRKPIEHRLEVIRRANRLHSSAAALNHVLQAAESQQSVAESLRSMQQEMAELARLWQPDMPWSHEMAESTEETNLRLAGSTVPQSLTEAAAASQRLTRRLLNQLEKLDALLPKEA